MMSHLMRTLLFVRGVSIVVAMPMSTKMIAKPNANRVRSRSGSAGILLFSI